jgi:hypothetical protein
VDSSGNRIIIAGTKTGLYVYTTSAWTLIGSGYAVPDDEFWSMEKFGTNVYCVNIADDPQIINLNIPTAATDAPGTPPKARFARAIGDFLVLGGLATDEQAVAWCDINDPTEWVNGLADSQTFPDGDRITGLEGAEEGYILQEKAVRRMTFIPGADEVFRFQRIENAKGNIAPYASTTVKSTVFYISNDGFYSISAQGLSPIGDQRVNKWFDANRDKSTFFSGRCAADPTGTRIFWFFYTSASALSAFDAMIVYDWAQDKWTSADSTAVNIQDVAVVGTPGTSIDAMTTPVDSQAISWDSRIWLPNTPVLAVIKANGKLALMSGPPAEATLTTPEQTLTPGRRSFVSGVTPRVEITGTYAAGTNGMGVSVASRETMQDEAEYGTEATRELDGKFKPLSSGRYHTFKVRIDAGATWTHAQGVEPEFADDGAA